MNHLFTPPINNPKFDPSQSIKESYKVHSASGSIVSAMSSGSSQESTAENDENRDFNKEPLLTQEEIDEINSLDKMPNELSGMIDAFIDDLKQPKYERPLSVAQLSSLFQAFYIRFDKQSFHFLQTNKMSSSASNTSVSTFFNARETLTSGIGGLFSRSRSSSTSTNVSARGRNRRSSSILSSDSNANNCTQMLSQEEIQRQLKLDEIINLKIEKYKDICERDLFKRILQVGTSVPTPYLNGNQKMSPSKKNQASESFNITNLFRNSPEFEEYDKLLDEKINCIYRFSEQDFFDLVGFLDIPDTNKDFNNEDTKVEIQEVLGNFTRKAIAPYEKSQYLLKMYEVMEHSKKMSNDDFLSLLIFYIIKCPVAHIFLNMEFVRLFRIKKKLVNNELFAITNLEAALLFVDGLTLSDFPTELQNKITEREREIFTSPLSSKVALPDLGRHGLEMENDVPELPKRMEVTRAASYEGFRSVFDSSLKNIIERIKTYPSPSENENLEKNGPINSPEKILNNKITDVKNQANIDNLMDPNDWKRYKDKNFDELTITELRDVFEIYKNLVKDR